MDENQVQDEINEVVETSPVATAKRARQKITYERVPMDTAISALPPAVGGSSDIPQPTENPDNGKLVNTTRPEPFGETTQHTNGEYPDSAQLVSSGGHAYIGGSVLPNSSVRASLRPMDRYSGDPFWLESTDRFAPVQPWTVKLAVLNEPAKLNTYDVDKAAYNLARQYQGVPEDDFFGYEYTPLEDMKETWWSSFWTEYGRSVGDVFANTGPAIEGLVNKEEAAKTPEQRAEESRNANSYFFGFARRKGQQYLDYLDQLEPIQRSRGAEILGGTGGALVSATPAILGIPFGPAGWVAGAAGATALSAVETQETRDKILESGGSVDEAQKGQWKHLGAVGTLELASGLVGQGVTQRLIRGAINRGASRGLTKVVGAVSEMGVAAPIDAVTEVYQDKFGNIIAGRTGYENLYGWSREDWNTFYSTLLLGAFQASAAKHEANKEFDKVANVSDDYLAMVARLKQGLVEKAASNGFTVSEETLARIDKLAMDIYRDPEGTFDADMRSVAQGFYDKLQNLPPEVVEQAKKLNTEQLQGLSEQSFKDLDKRVKSQPWWDSLSDIEQQTVLGEIRAGAYVGALWFGQSPADIKIPNVVPTSEAYVGGWFANPDNLKNTAQYYNQELGASVQQVLEQAATGLEEDFDEKQQGDIVLALRDELDDYLAKQGVTNRGERNFAKNTKVRRYARHLLENPKLEEGFAKINEKAKEYLEWKNIRDTSPEGAIGVVKERGEDWRSPYDAEIISGEYANTDITPELFRLNTLLHEFAHANDWNVTDKQINDLTSFIDWYAQAIKEVFGKERGTLVGKEIKNRYKKQAKVAESEKDTFVTKKPLDATLYSSPRNVTENRAQAVGRLLEDAKKYIGLTGKPAQFIQAANAILTGLDDTKPLPDGLSDYVSALKGYVKANSAVINRIKDKVPAERMRAAIQSYMGGNENINWQGITPMTLKEFADATKLPLDSGALQYALDSLGDIDTDDFVDKVERDWDTAWDKFYADNPDALKARAKEEAEKVAEEVPSETDVVVDERETDVDGGIDPEAENKIEDWDEDTGLSLSKYNPEDPLQALIDEATKKEGPSEFKKKVSKKFNGDDLESSMDKFKEALEEHEYKPMFTNTLDFIRGIPAFLSALGGKKLVDQFDLVNRYDRYSNIVLDANEKLVQRLLPLFGGSRNKYEDYIRNAGVRKFEIEYKDPYSTEKRLFSKRDLMSGILYNEQPDSTERIAKAVSDEEIRKHLDDFDIKFAHELRSYLRDEYTKVKGDNENVPVNYWPIIDQRSLERGDERIINDLGRKETDAPIGLLDVMMVIGAYQSRVAGTQSGYFAALRRLNSIVDYNPKSAMTQSMNSEDLELSDKLDKTSLEIRKMLRSRLSPNDYDRFVENIRDTISHRNDDALKDSIVSKIARNAITGLLGGKIKQLFINLSANVKWLGYEHNTYGSFMYGLFNALLHPARSIKLANENKTIVNRARFYRYNEYMEKNLSANSDNLMTYVANWATKHDVRPVEALADFLIHIGTWSKKTLGSFTVGGDYLANVFGYAASYNAAVKALGSEEAAKKSLSDFINTRQSTTNQAVKGLMVRKLNRQGVWGNIFAFTGENTQTWGTIAQDINRMASGDLAIGKGSREVTAEVLSMLSYVAVQAGWIVGLAAAAMGAVDLSDDDWDRIYDNVYTELLGQAAGIAGPLTNIISQPFLNSIVYGRDFNGLSIPMLAEINRIVKDAKGGDVDKSIIRSASLFGITAGLHNAISGAEGTIDWLTEGGKRRNAGFFQGFGFSEGMANRLAGVKKKKKK